MKIKYRIKNNLEESKKIKQKNKEWTRQIEKSKLVDLNPTKQIKCNEKVCFLKQIVIGNVKWMLYNYLEWKRLWGK